MDNLDEVMKILRRSRDSRTIQGWLDRVKTDALEIYQLFPPYQDALWSDKEGQCFWCKSPTHWLDICYEGYVCSAKCQQEMAQDVKSKSRGD